MSQTLLRKIQDAALDPSTDLPSLLRMCMVLASRLRNDTFKAWVDAELNGYKSGEPLPDYRVFSVTSEITLHNPFQGTGTLQVPRSAAIKAFGKEDVDDYFMARILQNVAEIAALIEDPGDGNLSIPWSMEAAARVAPFMSEWTALSARKVIGQQRLVGILDVVRTRVLKMSLELEETDPTLGEGGPADSSKPTEERVEQIVHQTINIVGDHTIISAPTTQTKVVAGDLASLRIALQQLGLSPQEVEETALAVKEETTPQGAIAKLRGLWDKLTGNKVVGKAAETGAVELVKHAIKDYFGT